MELLRGVSAANNFVFALVSLLSSQLFNSRSRPGGASATPPGCRKPITRIVAEQRDELAPFHCQRPPMLPTERIAHLSTADPRLRLTAREPKKMKRPLSCAGFAIAARSRIRS